MARTTRGGLAGGRWALALLCLPALAAPAHGSDAVEVGPLTGRVILVHFKDGRVEHHARGRPRSDEKVLALPLDTRAAANPSSFRLTSRDDPAYRDAARPIRVGRKTKGTDFAWFVDRWIDGRAVNDRPDHAAEHWIYLVLPRPMKRGAHYTLDTGALASNGRAWPLAFDERAARSEAVHVNPLGYVPAAPRKAGYLSHWMGDLGPLDLGPIVGHAFHLVDPETGRSLYTGRVALRLCANQAETAHRADSPPDGNFARTDVLECDFSTFRRRGRYVLSVDGVGCSFPFRLDDDVYRDAFHAVARALYHNRSGIALAEPYTRFTRPAPHNPRLTPGFAGKLVYTTVRFTEWGSEGGDPKALLAGSQGPIESAGWYQDAGDWDSYYSHLRVAQELLLAFELAPANFRDGELNIPESGNGLPDILDEAAWLPRFLYRLRHELLDRKYGTGGVGLRIAGDAFGSDEGTRPDGTKVGRGSWEDTDRTWAASGEDPWSTYRYAGVAACLAWCEAAFSFRDPERIDWRREAIQTYEWASSNTRPGDESKDPPLRDARSYAAAALFRLTGSKPYEQQFARDVADVQDHTLLWEDRRYGPMVYALRSVPSADPALRERIRSALLATADHAAVETLEKRAMRWGGNWYMPMLVGQQTTPSILEGAVGHELARQSDPARAQRYLASLYTTCDYFLGGNPLNMTWVTGLGPRHPNQVFHMDAWYNGKGEFHPGIIPYGPWRKERDLGQGPWDVAWPHKTVHPRIDDWPGSERWFDNRCSPSNSEFTVHQNLAPAASVFGLLCAPGPEKAEK
jgi:hypothetical protein